MAGEQGTSPMALAAVFAGALFLWSGVKGTSITGSLRSVLSGSGPTTTQTNAIQTAADVSSSGSSGGGPGAPLSGASGSNEAIMKQTAAQFGWTGSEWSALYNVEMREAGFNLTAQNPSSGAYGMAQFINGPSEYAQYGGNSTTASGQAFAMCEYIRQRYGRPSVAWAHEQSYGWY